MDNEKSENTKLPGLDELVKMVTENTDWDSELEMRHKNIDDTKKLILGLTHIIELLKKRGQFKEIPAIMLKIKGLRKQEKSFAETHVVQVNDYYKGIKKILTSL